MTFNRNKRQKVIIILCPRNAIWIFYFVNSSLLTEVLVILISRQISFPGIREIQNSFPGTGEISREIQFWNKNGYLANILCLKAFQIIAQMCETVCFAFFAPKLGLKRNYRPLATIITLLYIIHFPINFLNQPILICKILLKYQYLNWLMKWC